MHFVCTSQVLVAKALVSSADCNKLPIKCRKVVGRGEPSSERQEQIIKNLICLFSLLNKGFSGSHITRVF